MMFHIANANRADIIGVIMPFLNFGEVSTPPIGGAPGASLPQACRASINLLPPL